MNRSLLCPERIRKMNGSFAAIEHRFLRDGFLSTLHHFELILYIFLILVSDRNGVSWYSYDNICTLLRITLEEYIAARNGLIDKDLIAFDGHRFQVLSLPDKPVKASANVLKTQNDMERYDPATIDSMLSYSLRGRHDR